MLRTSSIALVLLTLISCVSPAPAITPAAKLCDDYTSANDEQRAERLFGFRTILVDDFGFPVPRHCFSSYLEFVDGPALSYCATRARIGHDLANDALEELESQLFELSTTCLGKLSRRRELWPKNCEQLESAMLAQLEQGREDGWLSEDTFACYEKNFPTAMEGLVKACDGQFSITAMQVEFTNRLERACPTDWGLKPLGL